MGEGPRKDALDAERCCLRNGVLEGEHLVRILLSSLEG